MPLSTPGPQADRGPTARRKRSHQGSASGFIGIIGIRKQSHRDPQTFEHRRRLFIPEHCEGNARRSMTPHQSFKGSRFQIEGRRQHAGNDDKKFHCGHSYRVSYGKKNFKGQELAFVQRSNQPGCDYQCNNAMNLFKALSPADKPKGGPISVGKSILACIPAMADKYFAEVTCSGFYFVYHV